MPETMTEAGIKQCLERLIDAPLRIAACTAGWDEKRLTTPPAPGEWSATEIMEHVRGSAEARTRTIQKILASDNPRIPYTSPRGWAKKYKYDQLSFAENFQAYQAERANLIGVLQGLTSEQWNRSGTFTGNAKTVTVFDTATSMANHDTAHCEQLEAIFPK
jgi:hypothetical protein